MITLGLILAAQWVPPVAKTNSPPPAIVTVTHSPPPPRLAVPAPPFPKAAPMPPDPRIVRIPLAKGKLQDLISQDDYPASALARREEGRVGFALEVGENGRVTGCTITRSSGSRVLDVATCRLMQSRARFTPALDSNGMPRAWRVVDVVVWGLAERPPTS